MDVFFYEAFDEEEKELKKYLPPHVKAGFTWHTIQESGHKSPPAKLISTRTQSHFPVEWAGNISGILSRSTGYDHIKDYQKKIKTAVSFGFLPLYCNRAVAEHALMLWISLLRKLPQQQQNFQSFYRDGITGLECEGKTLLVVGVGNIGSQLVNIGKGLGMKVLCNDIIKKFPSEHYVSIDAGLEQADVIVCAMNLTDQNANYFNYEAFKKAKRNAIFINISRGEFSRPSTLLKLLNEGHLGGVGLDVYDHEKELAVCLREGRISNNTEVSATLELSKKSNVILTPHNAFNSFEAVKRKSSQSVEQIIYFMEKGEFKWPVP